RQTASLELNSEHIIATAIVTYTKAQGVQIPKSKNFTAIPGKGIMGQVNGKEVYVGSPNLLNELNITLEDPNIKALQAQGKTVVFTIASKKLVGAFALSDAIRSEAHEAIRELKTNNIEVYMLTGDAKETAKKVSQELGIDKYFAQVLPAEKAKKIKFLQDQGHKVAMVGDGINDAPALVTADVGIAIGAGTDVAIESADIVLVKNDPRDVSKVEFLSRKTYSKMVQNLWWAAGYNIIAIPLATGILYGLNIVITPAIGALLMSMSTVLVAINSQTLRKYEPKTTMSVEKFKKTHEHPKMKGATAELGHKEHHH
ncbi:MAG: HAD-IC family P-type ATPase, partial [Candidatus Ranarchaeia archaeon]